MALLVKYSLNMVHLSSDMDLTELVLEEERDVDDEMDEEEEEVDKIKVEDEAAIARAKRRLSSFLNESFADDEDLDDEMDDGGEENGGGGEDGKSSSSASSTGGGGGCKYHCSECGESNFFSKKGLRQHVRVEHLETCYWTCQSCGGVFPDLELFKVRTCIVHAENITAINRKIVVFLSSSGPPGEGSQDVPRELLP